MDVSPENSGTITLVGASGEVKNPTVYPIPDSQAIDCFARNEEITITANPKSGYQFDYWEFNYWPLALDEDTDKLSNPLTFNNAYLANEGYVAEDNYDAIRRITAHFTATVSPPQPPANVNATDGTEKEKVIISWSSATGATTYKIYRATSLQGSKSQLGQTAETTFEDTTVTGTSLYYYWIQAVNLSGSSTYSDPDPGYAFVDTPPPPLYESSPLTPAEAKDMLDTDPEMIVLDVSPTNDFDNGHIICAINGALTVTDELDSGTYNYLKNYQDLPVLVVDQNGVESLDIAEYLAGKGFSDVYYMTGGMINANNLETVNSNDVFECSLPPMSLAVQDNDEVDVYEEQTVYLDGNGSKTADGSTPVAYEWQQYQGPTTDIINADSAEAMITTPNLKGDDEQLIFLLTVTDAENHQDTDSVAVDVKWENDPPVADAGTFQSVSEGETVTLNGSASEDTEDGIVAYLWEKLSGPAVTLEDSTKATAWFSAPAIDTEKSNLVFQLTVTDNGGLSDTDEVTIEVNRNNIPPTADAGTDLKVSETRQVQLDGSGSEDTDDGIQTYAWTQIGSPIVQLSSVATAQPTFNAPEVTGEDIILVFQLTVTDKSGESSTDQVSITVMDAGDPPLADAGTDQNPVYEGWQVTLDGSQSTDTDGQILSYQWTRISGPDVTITGANTATPKFTAPTISDDSAQLVLQLMVTDDTGLNGTDLVKIVIKKSTSSPTADAGVDQEVTEGDTVFLDGSGSSDTEDGISEYQWQQTGGVPVVNLSDSSAIKPEFQSPDVDKETILTFTLTVTDYSETQDTDEVQIRIRPHSSSSGSCFISTLNL